MKKDKAFEEGLDFDIIRKYSTKETAKTFTGLDSVGLVNDLVHAIPKGQTSLRAMVEYQIENLGYIGIVDKRFAGCCVVQDLDTKYSPKLKLYALANGNVIPVKIDKKTFNLKPLQKGDIIKVTRQYKKPKTKNVDGEWVQLEEKEWWITEYEIIRGDMV